MPTKPKLRHDSPAIHAALSRLRSRIRGYVLLDGVALALIWLTLTFWIFLAIDYTPVCFGMTELPWAARLAILILVATGLGWVLFDGVVRRICARLHDSSMALLIENKYPQFNDSLITTVGSFVQPPDETRRMLDHTRQRAEQHLESVNLDSIFNRVVLRTRIATALVLLMSAGLFAVVNFDAFETAARRLYLLDNSLWKRRCHVEVLGVQVKRENAIDGIPETSQLATVNEDQIKVAKGSSLTLLVRAEADSAADKNRRLPGSCIMRYWSESGESGRQAFKRIGGPRNGYQLYSLDGQPLEAVLSDISFFVRGGDHRVGPIRIRSVPSPVVIETLLICNFPDYMVDMESMRWTPRVIPYTGPSGLPRGTRIQIQCRSNKPLSKVYIADRDDKIESSVEPSNNKFQWPIQSLDESRQIRFYLCDRDGIVAEQPHTVVIESVEDQPPAVQSVLTGIGSAITPDAVIPISGSISDDYGIAKTWVEVETGVGGTLIEPVTPSADGKIQSQVDFRAKRQLADGGFSLTYEPASKIAVIVKSRDYCDLGGPANDGSSDRFAMDVVSPGQLLRILERLEVGQRRRLEQIFVEMNDARDYLVRTGSYRRNVAGYEPGDEPGDELTRKPGKDLQASQIKRDEFRLLFAQRAMLQVEKSTQEVKGVADVFENIRLQLINNRVDTEDRIRRLSDLVVAPLNRIVSRSMPDLGRSITDLQRSLESSGNKSSDQVATEFSDPMTQSAVKKADKVLTELDLVLGNLLKFETQNELLDTVRQMIRQQEQLLERTRNERQQQAFQGLLD